MVNWFVVAQDDSGQNRSSFIELIPDGETAANDRATTLRGEGYIASPCSWELHESDDVAGMVQKFNGHL